VKVGVLDLEFDGYKSLLGTELPDSVTVQCFCDGGQVDQMGGVHGAGVAEIIHDIAPDAELYLAAFQTDAEFQQAAEWLAAQGVKIISNSTGSNWGPKDGTSFSTGVIDSIVQKGVLWVNSAGNAADGHYRREFTDRDGDGWHDELIYFETFGSDSIALNWNAWSTGDQDYDLFIYDTDNNLVASSQDAQTGTFSASAEFIRFDAPDDGKRYYAAIQSAKTTGIYILDFFTNNGTVDQDLDSKEYSLDDEASSKLGLSIGAVYWADDVLESYSSQGPSNDGRLKPELSAPSVVSVESYGKEGFNGTSAATPHVSGAAALILSAAPDFSVQQIKDYLFINAVDLGETGSDFKYGYGRLFLGEIPKNSQLTVDISTPAGPESTATGVPPAQTPTGKPAKTPEIGLAVPTASSAPTASPQPVGGKSEENGTDTLLVVAVLGTLACVGLAGLLVVGLIALQIFSRRRKLNEEQVSMTAGATSAIYGGPPEAASNIAQETRSAQPLQEASIECPNCGRANRGEAKFCTNCGFKF
jgi:subtilisin family serine protease